MHTLIENIQKEATKFNCRDEVDRLIIKAQKQAQYSSENIGHFGLGFTDYTHFTSPIRRYSDLILHRLLKTIIYKEDKQKEYILKNIIPTTAKISDLEREAQKIEWDFTNRKFARWAKENIGNTFLGTVVDIEKTTIAKLNDKIVGARIFLEQGDYKLFDKIKIEITDVNIATAKIKGIHKKL